MKQWSFVREQNEHVLLAAYSEAVRHEIFDDKMQQKISEVLFLFLVVFVRLISLKLILLPHMSFFLVLPPNVLKSYSDFITHADC